MHGDMAESQADVPSSVLPGRLRPRHDARVGNGQVAGIQVSDMVFGTSKQDQPNALRGAPRAGGGDMGYLELPGKELGAFIDRLDRDRARIRCRLRQGGDGLGKLRGCAPAGVGLAPAAVVRPV